MSSNNPQTRIDASIAGTRAEIMDADRHRDSLVEGLATAENAKQQAEVQVALERCDEELARLRRKLADFEKARTIVQARDDRAKQLERFELANQARTRVDELGAVIEAEIEKLIAHIDGLRSLLANIEAVGQDRADAAYAVLRECSPDPSREWQDSFVGALKGQHHSARIVDALYASGFGRVGPWLAPFVEIAPARNTQSAEEINTRSRNLIAKRLGTLLKRREAQLNQETQKEAT
jgi:hypothetical protein